MKIFILIASSLFLSSCMHLGMMGTDGDHQSRDRQAASESVLEKEVTFREIKATAIFPPLQVGKEAMFTLKLTNVHTGQPLSGAQVSFHAAYVHSAEESQMKGMHAMHGEIDSAHARAAQEHDVDLDLEVAESSNQGIYVISFPPSQPGEHQIMFHITAIGDQLLEPDIVIEATRHASTSTVDHGGMMQGIGGASEYAIIGAALMGALMLVLWVTGGRMF